jgi:hypothetical protein
MLGGEKVILIPPFLFGLGLALFVVVGGLDLILTPLSTFLSR